MLIMDLKNRKKYDRIYNVVVVGCRTGMEQVERR